MTVENINVLHCIHSRSWGGLELYTVELIEQLQKAGVVQSVLCDANSRVAEELKKLNVDVIPLSQRKFSKIKEARLIRRLIDEKKITHLHSHTRLDMWACALAKWSRGKVHHVYNLYMNAIPKRDLVHKMLFSKVDALCSSSEAILNDARKNFPIDPKKLHLVRYGRNLDMFVENHDKRETLRRKFSVGGNQLVVGTLCRIDPGKGVRELVSALEHLTDDELAQIQLWVIGDCTMLGKTADGTPVYEGPSKALADWIDLQASTQRYKGHIQRIPFQKEYIPYIDALDIFALASYNETYSLSVLDAMIMGKPVLGTRAGGTIEQVGNNERGYLAKPADAKSLAEGMRFYLQNREKLNEQGHAGKQWVLSRHNWEKTLAETLAIYKSL